MQVHGAAKALLTLQNIADRKKLETFYLYYSLLGEIYSRLNNSIEAKKYFEKSINITQSDAEKKIIKEKIIALLNWQFIR